MKRLLPLLCALALPALASGLEDHGADLYPREKAEVQLTGFFRVRSDLLHNLDLDRGLTPSGRPLFAVPLADPQGQSLFSSDMRLRTDLAIYAPFAAAAVKVRADLVDDLVLGGTPVLTPGTGNAPTPAASPGQMPNTLLRIKRAYAEALTPVGLIAAGRMGNHWGLGMFSNGGDCVDCNLGDAADRIAFVTPIAGHLWALAYDFSAVGPAPLRKDGQRALVLDPSIAVQSVTFALMNVRGAGGVERRTRARKHTLEYGAFGSARWQDYDAPASYLPLTTSRQLSATDVMRRGYRAVAMNAWARLSGPSMQLGTEWAVLLAEVEQASLVPGVLLRDRVQSAQWGGVVESRFGAETDRFTFGLNGGIASGDPAPGFGAYPPAGTTTTAPGELDGPQVGLPRDARLDNLRFHPDYRVDRILFAEVVGTVTDAVYLRPWVKARVWDFSSTGLTARASATASRALFAESTPGGDANLGVELYAALAFESRDGFDVLAEYAVLFPLAGFDNPAAGLFAQPAQLGRLRLAWRF